MTPHGYSRWRRLKFFLCAQIVIAPVIFFVSYVLNPDGPNLAERALKDPKGITLGDCIAVPPEHVHPNAGRRLHEGVLKEISVVPCGGKTLRFFMTMPPVDESRKEAIEMTNTMCEGPVYLHKSYRLCFTDTDIPVDSLTQVTTTSVPAGQ